MSGPVVEALLIDRHSAARPLLDTIGVGQVRGRTKGMVGVAIVIDTMHMY